MSQKALSSPYFSTCAMASEMTTTSPGPLAVLHPLWAYGAFEGKDVTYTIQNGGM